MRTPPWRWEGPGKLEGMKLLRGESRRSYGSAGTGVPLARVPLAGVLLAAWRSGREANHQVQVCAAELELVLMLPVRNLRPELEENAAASGHGRGSDASGVIRRQAAPPLLRACAYYRFH